MTDQRRPSDESRDESDESRDDGALHHTTGADNAERVPRPESEPAEAGQTAAEEAGRLEQHNRPTSQPEEPGASRRDPSPGPPRT